VILVTRTKNPLEAPRYPRSVAIQNLTRGTTLATRERWAVTVEERTRGLLDSDGLDDGEALIISPCNSVHMFGMSFPLDVVFVDRAGTVVRVVEGLRPRRFTRIHLRARHTLELPVGAIAAGGTQPGDELDLGVVPDSAGGRNSLVIAVVALAAALVALMVLQRSL
jgi:uncharacterized protein